MTERQSLAILTQLHRPFDASDNEWSKRSLLALIIRVLLLNLGIMSLLFELS